MREVKERIQQLLEAGVPIIVTDGRDIPKTSRLIGVFDDGEEYIAYRGKTSRRKDLMKLGERILAMDGYQISTTDIREGLFFQQHRLYDEKGNRTIAFSLPSTKYLAKIRQKA